MSEKNAGKQGGRPTEREEPKRAAIALRTTPRIKERLSAAATAKGRSITQEVEARIEDSLDLEDMLSGPLTKALMVELARQIAKAEAATGKTWGADIATHRAAEVMVAQVMRTAKPTPEQYDEGNQLAGRLAQVDQRRNQLTKVLQDCAVIADRRNAFIALDMESAPIYEATDETLWRNPNHPDNLTDEERSVLRGWLKEWQDLGEERQTLVDQISEILGPYQAARAAGEQIAAALMQGGD